MLKDSGDAAEDLSVFEYAEVSVVRSLIKLMNYSTGLDFLHLVLF